MRQYKTIQYKTGQDMTRQDITRQYDTFETARQDKAMHINRSLDQTI